MYHISIIALREMQLHLNRQSAHFFWVRLRMEQIFFVSVPSYWSIDHGRVFAADDRPRRALKSIKKHEQIITSCRSKMIFFLQKKERNGFKDKTTTYANPINELFQTLPSIHVRPGGAFGTWGCFGVWNSECLTFALIMTCRTYDWCDLFWWL